MKLTGKENARLCIETSNEEEWTNSLYTIEELFNSYILGSIVSQLKSNDNIKEKYIKYLSIGNTILDKRCRINAKFRASLKFPKNIKDSKDFECICTYLDISDFYNFIVDLYIDYSKIFNTTITDIEIKMIEIEVKYPLSFTDKGFINTQILNTYDLDGQIDILLHFLKTQKWEIINNKIIFTELINDKLLEVLLDSLKKEVLINSHKQKYTILENCEVLGIQTVRKNIQKEIQKEKKDNDKLQTIIKNNQELYSLTLTRYTPKFTNLKN